MYQNLLDFIGRLPVFDAHEHLLYPQERYNRRTGFFDLLHYIESDLFSAGMTGGVTNPGRSIDENIRCFLKYYSYVKNTGYGRMVRTFARELYGITDINEQSLKRLNDLVLSKSLAPDETNGWYNYVLSDKCHIETSLVVYGDYFEQHNILKPIVYLDFLLMRSQIQFFIKRQNEKGGSSVGFEDYLGYVDEFLERMFNKGVLAGKFGTPYWRSLEFAEPDIGKAEAEYYQSESTSNPYFESYIYHYLLRKFEENGLPVQFHTGHVEPGAVETGGYSNHWSDPSPFGMLAKTYPKLKFVLLHTGFPYQYEFLSLVKNQPNIYADFSWIYIISPTIAKQVLNLAVEMLPANKIIGFGGDCEHVEMTFAHLYEARRVIAEVFASKVKDGYLDEADAKAWIKCILYENGREIYLKGDNN